MVSPEFFSVIPVFFLPSSSMYQIFYVLTEAVLYMMRMT